MGKQNFDKISDFLQSLNLTNEDAASDIFVVDIRTIPGDALTAYHTYRNNFYEIDLIDKQRFFEFTIDGVTYKPEGKPYVCFVSPNQLQAYQTLGKDIKAEGFLIYIPKSEIENKFFENIHLPFLKREFESYYELSQEQYKELHSWAKQIQTEFTGNQPFRKEIVRNLLSVFLIKSLSFLGEQKSIITSKPNQITDRFLELVKSHLAVEKTVQFYAGKLAISTKTLNEIVKQTTGKTALQLIHEHIGLEAVHQLLFSTGSIKEISYQLGFNEISAFSRWFKKQKGISPEKFRTTTQIDKLK